MNEDRYKSAELMKQCDRFNEQILPFMCEQLGNTENVHVRRLSNCLLEFHNNGRL